jgi:hypothetical protein
MENTEEKRQDVKYVTCDQEYWVKERIKTAIDMAIALNKRRNVGADDPLFVSGIDGIINGAAWEIIRTLGMDSECINLRNPYQMSNIDNEPIDKR